MRTLTKLVALFLLLPSVCYGEVERNPRFISGWTRSSTTVSLTTSTDLVSMGAATALGKLHAVGTATATEFIGLFAETGITPEQSAVSVNENRMVSVQGDDGAYFMARDVTNNIEGIFGTSSAGHIFMGSMSAHPFAIRSNNSNRMICASGGNCGFGADLSPDYFVDVQGALHADGLITGDASISVTAAESTDLNSGILGYGLRLATSNETHGIYARLRGGSAGYDGATSYTNQLFSSGGNGFEINAISGYLGLGTYGAESMRINSIGQVGIGVTPSYKLHIKSAGLSTYPLVVEDTADTSILAGIFQDSNGNSMIIGNDSSGTQQVKLTAGPEDSFILNGDVGIGTTNPIYKLHLYSSTAATNALLESTNSYADLRLIGAGTENYIESDDKLALWSKGVFGIMIDGGKIGIGENTPVSIFNIEDATAGAPATTGTTPSAGERIRFGTTGATGIFTMGTYGGNGMWMQSTSNADLSLSYPLLLNPNGGNVSVGETTPEGKFHVAVSDATTAPALTNSLIVNNANATTGNMAGIIFKQTGTLLGAGIYGVAVDRTPGARASELAFYKMLNNTLAEAMRIDKNGNVGVGRTDPTFSLDVYKAGVGPELRMYGDTFVGIRTDSGNAAAATRNWFIGSNYSAFGDFGIVQSNALGGNPVSAGTTRLYIDPSGNVGIGTTSPASNLQIGTPQDTVDSYAQIDNEAGAPPAGDCDAAGEAGRTIFDSTNQRLYVCNGAVSGWDYVQFT